MSQEQKNKLSESQKRRYLLNGNPLKGRKRPDLAGANSAHAHGVVRVNDGFMYQTVVDAASDNGISQSNVSLCCLGRLTHAGCMPGNNEWAIFRYKEDYDKMSDSEIENCLSFARAKKSNHKSIPVVCITTGEVFGSMKEAAMRYNLDPSELTKCCKGRKQFCGKDPNTNTRLSWQYIS